MSRERTTCVGLEGCISIMGALTLQSNAQLVQPVVLLVHAGLPVFDAQSNKCKNIGRRRPAAYLSQIDGAIVIIRDTIIDAPSWMLAHPS